MVEPKPWMSTCTTGTAETGVLAAQCFFCKRSMFFCHFGLTSSRHISCGTECLCGPPCFNSPNFRRGHPLKDGGLATNLVVLRQITEKYVVFH